MLGSFSRREEVREEAVREEREHSVFIARPRHNVDVMELCNKVMARFSKTLAYLAK